MLTHPHSPDLRLLEIADLDAPADPPEPARVVLEWARGYLSAPHPELGRRGNVCPFVPSSLRGSHFYVAVRPGPMPDVAETVRRHRDWFLELEPRGDPHAQLKTILILFPDVAPEQIDATQEALKPAFVQAGLMLGQFHPTPPSEGGLWNPDFRPLFSPVPLLAIRHMVPSDLPFLTRDRRHLESYLARFRHAVPPRFHDLLALAAANLGVALP
jgi:hypothetical protein